MNKLLVCIMLLSISVLQADILYSQIPDTLYSHAVMAQRDTIYPFETDVADDIVPTGGGWRIDSIDTWFLVAALISWDLVPNIHFIVYSDSMGQPADSPMVELVVENAFFSVYQYSGDRYRVRLPIPSQVVLDTQRYWIEIQTTNSLFQNGQLSILCFPNIGNGQEWYFRCEVLGYPVWTAATNIMGTPDELGFVLYGEVLSGVEDDPQSPISNTATLQPTITSGPLPCPEDIQSRIFDITGREIHTLNPAPGIYFLEVDGEIQQKVIKIK